ncbi:MAG: oxidoreductase [Actinomycetia bacterium]|nr:oxidoreductase [Actinomycetes bacterium]
MSAPVAVGLIGAGPWARMVTAPVFAAGPETTLAGVWSRTAAHADELAAERGVPAFDSIDALLDACDAVAIAVSPGAQPDYAIKAARAGKAVLLEKPIAFDVPSAQRMADAIGEAGVGSLVVLTYRYNTPAREFLARAQTFAALGGRGCFLSGAFLEGPFAMGWRLERGCLLDVGPHIIDLLDAALGEVVDLEAGGDVHGWVGVTMQHASGATSQASMCCRTAIEGRTEVELFGPTGALLLDGRAGDRAETFATLRREFAEVARTGGPHPVDVQRGLYLQRLLAKAEASL